MEAAIKTVVSVFLKSSKGKENLGGKEFQSLVKSQLKNILTVRSCILLNLATLYLIFIRYSVTIFIKDLSVHSFFPWLQVGPALFLF